MKIELVRTKKTNRVAIHSTTPEDFEPLLQLVIGWFKEHYPDEPLMVVKRDSINVRKNSERG